MSILEAAAHVATIATGLGVTGAVGRTVWRWYRDRPYREWLAMVEQELFFPDPEPPGAFTSLPSHGPYELTSVTEVEYATRAVGEGRLAWGSPRWGGGSSYGSRVYVTLPGRVPRT